MKRKLFLIFFISNFIIAQVNAQVLYVDAQNGNDQYIGSMEKPFKSISQALEIGNNLTGQGAIIIKIMPGIYTLKDKVAINPLRILDDTTRYIIEAAMMPDDPNWAPEKMPSIQSISDNNSTTFFPHATGFLVSSAYVTLRGLRFLGNPHPQVAYYYPISKEDQSLESLEVRQCQFIGNKEAAKIQGGIWAHGPNNIVANCVFYECRNAVLFFNNVSGFTIKNSIIYGSYESAFWFGAEDYSFNFSNNIISNNNHVIVGSSKDLKYSSSFSNSLISNNKGYVGYWSRDEQKIINIDKPNIVEKNIIKSGTVHLVENKAVKLDKMHLHLHKDSPGGQLKAGIFTK